MSGIPGGTRQVVSKGIQRPMGSGIVEGLVPQHVEAGEEQKIKC